MAIYDYSANKYDYGNNLNGEYQNVLYDFNGNAIIDTDPIVFKVMTYNVGQWFNGNGYIVPGTPIDQNVADNLNISSSLLGKYPNIINDYDSLFYAIQNETFNRNDVDIAFLCEYKSAFSRKARSAISLLHPYLPYYASDDVSTNVDSDYYGHAVYSKYKSYW